MPPEADPATPPTPEATPPAPDPSSATPPEPKADDDLGGAGKKALDAERARAKEADKRAKAAEAELEKFRKSQMSDQEKAVAQARDEGKAEATSAAAQRLAGAEIKAALAGVVPVEKIAEIIDDTKLEKYIGEDGEPDVAKIAALRDRYAALTAGATPGTPPPPPGVPKGARSGNGEVKQLSKSDLVGMSAEQIVAARKAGQLTEYMATPSP